MTLSSKELDDMVQGYLECALWTGTHGEEDAEVPMDRDFDISDFNECSRVLARDECKRFQNENREEYYLAHDLRDVPPNSTFDECFGHDFWLTRNGHGTGFWDRDLGEAGELLTEAAKDYGERYAYVGDDGKVYLS